MSCKYAVSAKTTLGCWFKLDFISYKHLVEVHCGQLDSLLSIGQQPFLFYCLLQLDKL